MADFVSLPLTAFACQFISHSYCAKLHKRRVVTKDMSNC